MLAATPDHPERMPPAVRRRSFRLSLSASGESTAVRDGSPHVASARSAHARYGAAANDGTAAPATTASENAAGVAQLGTDRSNPSSPPSTAAPDSAAAAASAAATAASVACAPTRVPGSPMVSAATSAAATRCRKSCAEAKHARAKNGKKSARYADAPSSSAKPSHRSARAPAALRGQCGPNETYSPCTTHSPAMANIDSTSARLQMDSCVRVSSACCVTGATLVAMRSAPKRARKHADRTLGRCEAAWNVAATKSAREERSWNAIAPRLARPCRPDGIDCRGAEFLGPDPPGPGPGRSSGDRGIDPAPSMVCAPTTTG